MKILFEEYKYQTKVVNDILGDFLLSQLDQEKDTQQLRYVGYFFNKNVPNHDGSKGDLVFILPKVLIDKDGLVFGLKPEKLIDFNYKDWKKDESVVPEGKLSKRQVYNFIYGFTIWIYRAVNVYRKSLLNQKTEYNTNDDEISQGVMTSLNVGKNGGNKSATYIDIILGLIDFQRTHKDFITYAIKLAHSGHNKISWPKTIARCQAVIQDGCPIYLYPLNKTRVINFDEELLVIYFSILNYINEEYGFPISNQPGYKLINGAKFKSYLKSQGKIRLHKIRYKYYSDSGILLWNLCYAFFDKSDSIKASGNKRDYLLVHKFETVFEGMIDELIGDKNLPKGLKIGADDKRIDHIYTYQYLIENLEDRTGDVMNRHTYNIADSKYYGRDKQLRGHDVPKQFTYARNVIQWHMDLLHDLLDSDRDKAQKYKNIPLFDPITEGYNIIPNFFISAIVDDDLNYDKDNFSLSTLGNGGNAHESFFFCERLFDRNSYFTLHYDINFLYIMKMYAMNKSFDKASWKHVVRKKFRNGILKYLNEEFRFYQIIIPEKHIDEFVEKYYRKVQGKVFSFEDVSGIKVLMYAERKSLPDGKNKGYSHNDSKDVHIEIDEDVFNVIIPGKDGLKNSYRAMNVTLGLNSFINPNRKAFLDREHYEIRKKANGVELVSSKSIVSEPTNKPKETFVLVGHYRSLNHFNWIRNNKLYNSRIARHNKYVVLDKAKINARYLILHNDDLDRRLDEDEIIDTHIFKIKPYFPSLMAKDELNKSDDYVPGHSFYMVYELEPYPEKDLAITELVKSKNFKRITREKKPLAFKLSRLKKLAAHNTPSELKAYFDNYEDFVSLVADDYAEYYINKKNQNNNE